MSGKELILDFINYAFIILVGAFFFFYFIAGNKLPIFQDLLKILVPITIFGIIFILKFKKSRALEKFIEESKELEDTVAYLTPSDTKKDKAISFILSLLVLALAAIDGFIYISDFIQAGTVFLLMFFWHLYLFRPEHKTVQLIELNYLDKIKDEVFVFLLPVVLLMISVIEWKMDTIDALQALSVFTVLYLWNFYLFKHARDI